MSLSIRNQFPGTVASVVSGEVMATVKTRLAGGQDITSAVTREAVEELRLTPGSPVRTMVKSTDVSLATGPVAGLSIRNQIAGTVADVSTGGAMATVKITIDGGELTAAITKDAVADLGIAAGAPVVALIKSTEVSLATA
ncbi:TOBE domain-containing protein [Streptacidiphilus cavernicola]|uniref:Molybdopterin-binding protein n=1 Tax=Streptacidiphilus cavernicola TaxID=3342716 RepID=A0ABV6VND2_9ACTN